MKFIAQAQMTNVNIKIQTTLKASKEDEGDIVCIKEPKVCKTFR